MMDLMVLDFGQFTDPGIYTACAEISYADDLDCWTDMAGEVEIYEKPLLYSQAPAGEYCPPQEILLTGSQLGVDYVLFHNNSHFSDTMPGTGNLFSFGIMDAEGMYYIKAINQDNCSRFMEDTTTILAEPEVYNIQPATTVCTSVEIILNGSQVGYNIHSFQE